MTKVPDLRAAKAEFSSYIADKSRYVSITEQQGPLRHGEQKLLGRRRWYIKQRMQWDAERLCWRNKDGRPLIVKDLIWDTVISEMRQLDTHGQRLVWTTVKAKYDGILEDDVRTICQAWYRHGLSQLISGKEPQWTLYRNNVELTAPSDPPSSTRRTLPGDPLRETQTSMNNNTSGDDVSSHDHEPLQDYALPQNDAPPQNDVPPQNDEPAEEDESSEDKQSSQGEAILQDDDLGCQFVKCVLIPQKHATINKNPPKRRRANSTEMLQKYTKKLEEKEAKRPSRQAKQDIDELRGIGGGIYASNAKPFAQEAAERIARTRALEDFVDNASPAAPKDRQGRAPKKRSPSSTPIDDDSDDDDSSDDDEDDGDWKRVRPDPELDAKHRRLLMAMGHNMGQQAAHGPMLA